MPRDRDASGTFVETVGPEDVLNAFEEVEGPALTSGDVSDILGCTRETARRKLHILVDRGEVGKRRTAGRVVLYWRLDES